MITLDKSDLTAYAIELGVWSDILSFNDLPDDTERVTIRVQYVTAEDWVSKLREIRDNLSWRVNFDTTWNRKILWMMKWQKKCYQH